MASAGQLSRQRLADKLGYRLVVAKVFGADQHQGADAGEHVVDILAGPGEGIAESRQRFPGGFSRPGNCRLDPVQRVSVAIWARTAPDMTSAEKALAYRARPARSSLVISPT